MKVNQGIIDIPEFKKYPEFKGCFIGGCVDRGIGSSFRKQAHAHNCIGYKNYGWICVRSTRRVYKDNGKLTPLMWHELAHLLCPNHGHDDKWREKMHELGQRVPIRYNRKNKKIITRVTDKL